MLQEGRRYRNKLGTIEGPMALLSDPHLPECPWISLSTGHSFAPDGSFMITEPSVLDLITTPIEEEQC
jgi:hypothetical protein